MSTALDVDIAALVGEMEAPPCESIDHVPGDIAHNDGPAEQYVRMHCINGCGLSVVKAYCRQFIQYLLADNKVRCPCERVSRAHEIATILGPVHASFGVPFDAAAFPVAGAAFPVG